MEKLTIARAELSALIGNINRYMSWSDYPHDDVWNEASKVYDILHDAEFQTEHLFDNFNGYHLDVDGIFKYMTDYTGQCGTAEMVFILLYNIADRQHDGRISRENADKASGIIDELTEDAKRNIRRTCICGSIHSVLLDGLVCDVVIE